MMVLMLEIVVIKMVSSAPTMAKWERPDAQVCINFDLVPPNGTRLLFEVDRVLMLAIRHAGGSPSVARLVMLMLIMVDVVSVLLLDSPLPINCEN